MKRRCKAFLKGIYVVCVLFTRNAGKLSNRFPKSLKNNRSVTVDKNALRQHLI